MIFVTVGTHSQSFDRLVKAVDDLVSENRIKEKVIMQIGHTKYEPKHCEWFRFTNSERIENLYKTADIIIAHGGAGSIINSLKYGKIPIVVPRLKKFNEHVNDHQLDLARVLGKERKIITVYDTKELENVLEKAKEIRYNPQKENLMIKTIKNFIEEIPS